MFKTFVTFVLAFILFASTTDTDAATKKSKRKISKTTDGKFKRHYSKLSKRKKAKRFVKYKKRGGSSVDLRALTTESPYTDNPDNGVNSVETKPGIQ